MALNCQNREKTKKTHYRKYKQLLLRFFKGKVLNLQKLAKNSYYPQVLFWDQIWLYLFPTFHVKPCDQKASLNHKNGKITSQSKKKIEKYKESVNEQNIMIGIKRTAPTLPIQT